MPSRAGTVQRRGIVGVREDLSDIVHNVDPTGFVFQMNAGTGPRPTQTFFEWQTDKDRPGNANNRVPEGNVSTFKRPTTTVRLGNYTQIAEDTLSVSGTTEAISAIAGRSGRESGRLLMKKMREIQRDMELSFWRNPGAAASANAVNEGLAALEGANADDAVDDTRITAGIRSFIKTNFVSRGSNRGTGVKTVTTGVTESGPRTGTWSNFPYKSGGSWFVNPTETNPAEENNLNLGPMTENALRELLTNMFDENETEIYDLVAGARVRVQCSGFDGIAEKTHNVTGNTKPTVVDSIDVWVGDFHVVRIGASRHIWPVDAFLMDWSQVKIRYLRPMGRIPLARRGDSREWLINVEYALEVGHERSLGAFTDLDANALTRPARSAGSDA